MIEEDHPSSENENADYRYLQFKVALLNNSTKTKENYRRIFSPNEFKIQPVPAITLQTLTEVFNKSM